MDNPKKLATKDTQDEDKQNNMCWTPLYVDFLAKGRTTGEAYWPWVGVLKASTHEVGIGKEIHASSARNKVSSRRP